MPPSRGAHAVVELELSIGRHSGVPLETRGAIARYDEARDVLEMHGAAKVPHWNRDTLAQMLGPASRDAVQLYEGHVGGGFGIRGEIYPEDVLVCAAALKFRRPVKWIEDRREHLIAANHSRQQQHRIRAAIDAEGHILGIDDEFFHDNGAYMRTHAATVPDLAAAMLPGPYRVPAYRATGHIRLTNKTPCGTYRAPGRYESTFVRERLLDAIAAQVGVDSVEIRRRNLIAQKRHALCARPRYARHAYRLRLRRLRAAAGQGAGSRRLGRAANANCRRAAPPAKRSAPAWRCSWRRAGSARSTTCASRSRPDGTIEVVTGVASVGQGMETVMAQICAETLGVDYAASTSSTARPTASTRGMGAFASRVTVMCGEATRLAATQAARSGAREAAAADADGRRRARHRRRRDRAQAARSVDAARRIGRALPAA